MTCAVVDTNVILVANGQHSEVSSECVMNCALRLQAIMQSGKLALDEGFLILLEYQNKTTPKRGNRPGDAFVRWALQNRVNTLHVDCVHISEHASRGFDSFPDDPALASFDPPDQKFVAVARAHGASPPILQAADSKWLGWEAALRSHAVTVDFVCPHDIKRFQDKKLAK